MWAVQSAPAWCSACARKNYLLLSPLALLLRGTCLTSCLAWGFGGTWLWQRALTLLPGARTQPWTHGCTWNLLWGCHTTFPVGHAPFLRTCPFPGTVWYLPVLLQLTCFWHSQDLCCIPTQLPGFCPKRGLCPLLFPSDAWEPPAKEEGHHFEGALGTASLLRGCRSHEGDQSIVIRRRHKSLPGALILLLSFQLWFIIQFNFNAVASSVLLPCAITALVPLGWRGMSVRVCVWLCVLQTL